MTARCGTAPALRAKLRAATQDDHQELDDALGRLDLADRHDYACFLRVQSRARIGVENWLARCCPPEWLPPAQTGLIEADLAALGCAEVDAMAPTTSPPKTNPSPNLRTGLIPLSSNGQHGRPGRLARLQGAVRLSRIL